MQKPGLPPNPTLETMHVPLKSLDGNLLDTDTDLEISIWRSASGTPAGAPLLICLAAYLNSGPGLTGWRAFGETIPERLQRLVDEGKMAPATVVFVDSYNRLGGTQFVNSPIIGNWVDALADDLVPFVEGKYNCGGPGKRGLFGHSSGGFGAIHNLAKRPDVWSAAASHAGDCGFDWVYRNELPKALRVLSEFDFDTKAFLDAFWDQEKPKGEQISALMMLAMAASYDPGNPGESYLGIRLPVTHDTCELIDERWAKWLDFDLLSFGETEISTLKAAKAIYFDCGLSDEYNILFGSRRLRKMLVQANIPHEYQEFKGGHGTIGPRYEVSLPYLVSKMT